MAKKVAAPEQSGDVKDAGSDDLAVLHPNRTFVLAGVSVTMREYGFVEGLKLMALLEPLIADLRVIIDSATPLPGGEQVPVFFGNHADALVELMAVAADVDIAWVEALAPDDGHELLWWWWCVNGPFCMRAAARRAAIARATNEYLSRAGPISMPSSSAPDTATPTPSDA